MHPSVGIAIVFKGSIRYGRPASTVKILPRLAAQRDETCPLGSGQNGQRCSALAHRARRNCQLRQPPGENSAGAVRLVEILATKSAAPNGYSRAIGIDDEFLTAQTVVTFRPAH